MTSTAEGGTAALVARILRRIREQDGCWLWQGATTSSGCPVLWVAGKPQAVSHVLYAALFEPLSPGRRLHRSCQQSRCVSPVHVAPAQPKAPRPRHVRSRVTVCAHGHPYDAANTYLAPTGQWLCRACQRHYAARRRARPEPVVPRQATCKRGHPYTADNTVWNGPLRACKTCRNAAQRRRRQRALHA